MASRKKETLHKWISLSNMSLATAARESGFDLAVYHEYSESTQQELRKRTIKQTISNICDEYEWETEDKFGEPKALEEVEYGVYVIRLSSPFTVRYRTPEIKKNTKKQTVDFDGTSQIVYIGKGDVKTRLERHLKSKLFDFMLSLSGANFDFQILDPKSNFVAKDKLYTQIENDLLVSFSETVTCKEKSWPLLNKISGSDEGVKDCGKSWNLPLRKNVKRLEWAIEPTEKWRKTYLDR